MIELLTPDQIAAMPYACFGKAGVGDFIETTEGVWKEILYITWDNNEKRWYVTTVDKCKYYTPDVFRYKINPSKPEGPAFM